MALSAEDRICSVCGSGKGILQLSSGETVCSKCIADAGLIRSTARDVPDAAALRADIDRMQQFRPSRLIGNVLALDEQNRLWRMPLRHEAVLRYEDLESFEIAEDALTLEKGKGGFAGRIGRRFGEKSAEVCNSLAILVRLKNGTEARMNFVIARVRKDSGLYQSAADLAGRCMAALQDIQKAETQPPLLSSDK